MYTVKGLNLFLSVRRQGVYKLYSVQIVHFTVQFKPMPGHFCLKNDRLLNVSGSVSQCSSF